MHHFARNECLPQRADASLLLKVLHKAEVLLFCLFALWEQGELAKTQTLPIAASHPPPGRRRGWFLWDGLAAVSTAHGGSRPLHRERGVSQELGAIPASAPKWGSAFDFEGTVMSSSGPGNLSLIRKEKFDSSRPPGQEIHFGYLCFQKETAFSPPYTEAATS